MDYVNKGPGLRFPALGDHRKERRHFEDGQGALCVFEKLGLL